MEFALKKEGQAKNGNDRPESLKMKKEGKAE